MQYFGRSENFTFCRGVPQNFLTDAGIVHLNGGRLRLPLSLPFDAV
jgi:hypothetical protein